MRYVLLILLISQIPAALADQKIDPMLQELWRSTVDRSPDIQFVIHKLGGEDQQNRTQIINDLKSHPDRFLQGPRLGDSNEQLPVGRPWMGDFEELFPIWDDFNKPRCETET